MTPPQASYIYLTRAPKLCVQTIKSLNVHVMQQRNNNMGFTYMRNQIIFCPFQKIQIQKQDSVRVISLCWQSCSTNTSSNNRYDIWYVSTQKVQIIKNLQLYIEMIGVVRLVMKQLSKCINYFHVQVAAEPSI